MTDHEATDHICIDCEENLLKKFDKLLSSFSKETHETIYELIHINDLIKNSLLADIKGSLYELNKKGCSKAFISFTGKTIEGKKIKLKDEVTIRFDD